MQKSIKRKACAISERGKFLLALLAIAVFVAMSAPATAFALKKDYIGDSKKDGLLCNSHSENATLTERPPEVSIGSDLENCGVGWWTFTPVGTTRPPQNAPDNSSTDKIRGESVTSEYAEGIIAENSFYPRIAAASTGTPVTGEAVANGAIPSVGAIIADERFATVGALSTSGQTGATSSNSASAPSSISLGAGWGWGNFTDELFLGEVNSSGANWAGQIAKLVALAATLAGTGILRTRTQA